MKTTIFEKMMMLFLIIIVIALFIAGLLMSQLVRDAYLDDNKAQLLQISDDVGASVSYYYRGLLTKADVARRMATKASENSVVVWITNWDGTAFMVADQEQTKVGSADLRTYYDDMLNELEQGNIVVMTTQNDNVFGTPVMTVARPIIEDGTIINYVFVHKQLSQIDASLVDIYMQILLSVAISAALGIVLTYIFTRNILRPLTVVNKGAQQLSKGNFDIYLEVKSTDEIGQFADTFNTLAQDLKKHESTRESFVANVSHELRSPLTSIQGLLQAVLDGTVKQDDAEHYLNIVLGETKRLSLLISDLLDLARIESGQFPMKIEEVDINEMIRRALIMFESKIDAKKLEVEVLISDDRVFVYADPNRLAQVLQNVIDNAVKFAGEGGRLRISTLLTDVSVFVSINNSGEVIGREDLPYVFDRFYKADKAHTREKEGTGIGLSLVRKILSEHRQKIWVESDEVDGTTFTFTLRRVEKAQDEGK
jgi:signal transduction histidine kinase